MLIKQIAGRSPDASVSDAVEQVFVSIHNSTGAALSAGYSVCWNTTLNASANGIDVQQPLTSALPNYAGVVSDPTGTDTNYSIADTEYGLAQVYGYNTVAYIRVESTDTAGAVEGTAYGPITGQWYLGSNGRSYEFGPVVIMSRLAANTFESNMTVFIRAL